MFNANSLGQIESKGNLFEMIELQTLLETTKVKSYALTAPETSQPGQLSLLAIWQPSTKDSNWGQIFC